ncbi:MAG: Spy/CpxP family protein refolding chaperone [Bacteroidales bacterium]
MNKYTKKQLLIGGLVLLVVINLAALGTVLYNNYQQKQNQSEEIGERRYPNKTQSDSIRHPKRGDHFGQFIKEKLNFDKNQYNEFSEIRRRNRQKQMSLHKKMQEKRNRMMEELASDQPNEDKLLEINDSITEIQSELNKVLINYFKEVREICNPEQREEFNKLIRDMHERRHKQHRHSPGRQQKQK